MDYKKIIFPAFIVLVLLQLYTPASLIIQQEDIINTGKVFKFKTAPLDPADPFRGRYVRLHFEENEIEITDESKWKSKEPIYISLTTDEAGFAKIDGFSKTAPDQVSDFVKAEVYYIYGKDQKGLRVAYPFDQFYMEESKAYEAELAYRESRRDTSQLTYALVKVKNGGAVLENVLIDGVPIQEVVEQRLKEQN